MLLPLTLDLGLNVVITPTPATVSCALPTITLKPPRPLWVNETPQDTIVVNPDAPPVGSFQ